MKKIITILLFTIFTTTMPPFPAASLGEMAPGVFPAAPSGQYNTRITARDLLRMSINLRDAPKQLCTRSSGFKKIKLFGDYLKRVLLPFSGSCAFVNGDQARFRLDSEFYARMIAEFVKKSGLNMVEVQRRIMQEG